MQLQGGCKLETYKIIMRPPSQSCQDTFRTQKELMHFETSHTKFNSNAKLQRKDGPLQKSFKPGGSNFSTSKIEFICIETFIGAESVVAAITIKNPKKGLDELTFLQLDNVYLLG